jgi:3-deoxy-manno-octulosonate cytidylyltransferase (CMP-KDO synthetase)
MPTLIVVPARYGSTRFPGKPLAKINGITMVRRTARIASIASAKIEDCSYVVATDDARIAQHCDDYDVPYVMTPEKVKTGSDRALSAAQALSRSSGKPYNYIINLQGDAPFTPVSSIVSLAETIKTGADVATPYIQLTWAALEALREHKNKTPFSGTTVIVGPDGYAIWFSKNIIPAIRKENTMREAEKLSPVNRHIGLYAYTYEALQRFTSTSESHYEKLEGLEQLRFLENDMTITCVRVEPPAVTMSGIDTPSDVELAESLIAKHGDPFQ